MSQLIDRLAGTALVVTAVWVAGSTATAQQPAAKPPAGQPATKPVGTPIAPPPGFVRVTANGRTALCAAADEAWVKAGLSAGKPATQPTTKPADLLTRLADAKATLAADIQRELGLRDVAATSALLTDELPKIAKSYQALKPPVVFMVTTQDGLKAALKAGWTNPQLRLNRATDDIGFDIGLAVNTDGPMDEALMPALYKVEDPAAERAPKLGDFVARIDTDVAQTVANRCELAMQVKLVEFVTKQAIDPLKLKTDQTWVGIGLADYFSAKYLTTLTSANLTQRIELMTMDPRYAPVTGLSVDLLKPVPVEALREEVVPFYLDARRRKATAVIFALSDQTTADAPVKLLAALKTNVPANNAGLVELIKASTGKDPTDWLRPQ